MKLWIWVFNAHWPPVVDLAVRRALAVHAVHPEIHVVATNAALLGITVVKTLHASKKIAWCELRLM
jgi:hypothetical protein